MTRRVLLVESNTSGTGRLFARAARTLGFEPVLLARQPDRYPYAAEDGVPTVVADTGDETALETLVADLNGAGSVAGITSSSEYFIATAARLARRWGLPAPDADAVAACRDKAVQRRRLAEAGVDEVRHAAVGDPQAAVAAARALGFPVVVKPVSASGSVGVRLCSTPAEVATHVRTLPAGSHVLVEEAIGGAEYSVEIFHDAVVGITAKHTGALPHFVEIGHEFPAPVAADLRSVIADFALAAVRALGLTWGPVHVELRADGARLHLMEVNPRLAGGFIPELVRYATGIDLVLETMRLVAGGVPDLSPRKDMAAAIRFLLPDTDGILHGVSGLDAARTQPGVRDARLYRLPPAPVARRGDFQDRIGHVLAAGPTVADAMTAAGTGLSLIQLHIAASGSSLTAAA